MVYKAIGLMSGSSLDGLDIVYTFLEEVRGQWTYEIQHADCIPYSEEWKENLKQAAQKDVHEYLKLNTRYGKYLAEQVNHFIEKHRLQHKVHLIASHGHTVFHEPGNYTSTQIGDGATIAALTGLPVVSDLRSMDVSLGGQGAPIVSIGDKLLFGNYDYWLNIGGIVNITVVQGDRHIAFDVCTGNQALNALAEREGQLMDENGKIAAAGKVLPGLLEELNAQKYFSRLPPKSLSNEAAQELIFPMLFESPHSTSDLMRTVVEHIANQVANVVKQFPHAKESARMFITGGGAFNHFLIEQLAQELLPLYVVPIVPADEVVKYKEALVMALIGLLRWREEVNVLSSVTGAARDTISGALWMGH